MFEERPAAVAPKRKRRGLQASARRGDLKPEEKRPLSGMWKFDRVQNRSKGRKFYQLPYSLLFLLSNSLQLLKVGSKQWPGSARAAVAVTSVQRRAARRGKRSPARPNQPPQSQICRRGILDRSGYRQDGCRRRKNAFLSSSQVRRPFVSATTAPASTLDALPALPWRPAHEPCR
jgi:hypothetical protein